MKKKIIYSVIVVLIVLLIVFIITSIGKASRQYPPAGTPELNPSAIVFYGQVQPPGKEIGVSPRVPGIVHAVKVILYEKVRFYVCWMML
jgi:hypothetical protein